MTKEQVIQTLIATEVKMSSTRNDGNLPAYKRTEIDECINLVKQARLAITEGLEKTQNAKVAA